jgi:hypothetical protein
VKWPAHPLAKAKGPSFCGQRRLVKVLQVHPLKLEPLQLLRLHPLRLALLQLLRLHPLALLQLLHPRPVAPVQVRLLQLHLRTGRANASKIKVVGVESSQAGPSEPPSEVQGGRALAAAIAIRREKVTEKLRGVLGPKKK